MRKDSDKLLEAMNANINYFDSLASIGLRADSSQVLYRLEYIKKLYLKKEYQDDEQ